MPKETVFFLIVLSDMKFSEFPFFELGRAQLRNTVLRTRSAENGLYKSKEIINKFIS
jgi:hypothetical protein